jgi:hypothetical protein
VVTSDMVDAGLAVWRARQPSDSDELIMRLAYDAMERVRIEERGRPSLWPDYMMGQRDGNGNI